ncbi:hypothetical protein LWP59_00890 [Amycolatopsis acidiphila]|uniref:Uncharacterized protein n=1 Tax=Amycolatopsis acidiphila TaxID=715473 RepID=A0A558AMQ1_9PSEU|nr:hypothetical protein [Amycolatopsis acidiphila]TVT25544.1 hypothetical protein FNH06_01655 [Amycolatopsis acidiphila]UIJ60291.1 hypothetical protein LWP59_00890 [Amycolatopsis acidiphila]GHG60253.1 hypothetical protein GCM10017788_13850 [Amycolatopsis acidiphila]
MTYRRPRSGVIATVDGRDFQADSYPREGVVTLFSREAENPDPTHFAPGNGLWLATVPLARCDRLAEVTSVAEYRGHTCQVVGIDEDGTTGLYYLGDDMAAMPRDGFVQVDPGTWAKTVHIGELARYRELHRDLLFDAWVRGGGNR